MLKMPLRAYKDLFDMTESHWHGKPLSTLTKDELIKALEQLAELYDIQANSHEHDLNILVPRT